MSRKYFFFDYDGTLAVYATRTIPASTRECLRLLQEAGHFVAIATGRLQCNALDYIENLGITNIVADGGYSVTRDGQLLWMQGLELESCKRCLRSLDVLGIPWAVQTANEMLRHTPYQRFDDLAGDYYVPTQVDPGLTIDSLQQVFKIYIPCAEEDTDALVATGVLDGMPWVRYKSHTIFVEPMDKALGIKKMMDLLGAPYNDVVVFGDGKNDISMFIPEWTSIAMGNAKPQLKERADYVTAAVEDDGIMKACRHFGWIA